jgi:divalent metal cation (Fe/Co/Zn/Cd) transporter
VVFVVSGSVALLGDALHNLADSLTTVPLGLAFLVDHHAEVAHHEVPGRRTAT